MAATVTKVTGSMKEDRKRFLRATVKYRVLFSPPSTGSSDRRDMAAALDYAGVPQIADGYDYNNKVLPKVVCIDRDCIQDENNVDLFHITCQFSDELFDTGNSEINPLLRPTKYSWAFDQFQKAMDRDLDTTAPFTDGQPIVNSAGDPFSAAPLVDDSRPVGRVMRNEADFPVHWAEYYQDATNSSAVTINGQSFSARTLKMRCITSGETQYEQGTTYYTVTYDIQVRREGWKLKILDSGFRSLDGGIEFNGCAEPTATPCRDQNGVIMPNESRLNGSGFMLCPSEDSEYLEFQVYREVDFNTLGL